MRRINVSTDYDQQEVFPYSWYFNLLTVVTGLFILLYSLNLFDEPAKQLSESLQKEAIEQATVNEEKSFTLPSQSSILDVPLFNQMEAPKLFNGCEVTSLAMLLGFWGINVTKNELAGAIQKVPLRYSNGKFGNPNIGFVGNMETGPGLGVYHEPIFDLAKSYLREPFSLENLTKKPFSSILEHVSKGLPVWVITTTNFAPPDEFETWSTPQGPVKISLKMHAAVITGYDEENIYLNDPFGTKNKKVNKDAFILSWELMGSQAIVIKKK